MNLVVSQFGSHIGEFLPDRSYWAVKLKGGRWLSEIDPYQGYRPHTPHYDWSLDLVATGDVLLIDELWLFCPRSAYNSWAGNTARLKITEPGTAFQLQGGRFSLDGGHESQTYQLIGQVTDKETGACRSFVWDARYQLLIAEWQTSVYNFAGWDEAVRARLGLERARRQTPPIGRLAFDVLGLRF